ncbi:MAG: hypothetical protein QQW96_16060 [Tychonema bourrellyi B0820]|nr:hypothetical protein [Tychonema bourrellyi]MDQ2099148.1 hypothetical protein [Tychonema bourrellyi B0820]
MSSDEPLATILGVKARAIAINTIDISQKACQEQAGCLFHNNYRRCLI